MDSKLRRRAGGSGSDRAQPHLEVHSLESIKLPERNGNEMEAGEVFIVECSDAYERRPLREYYQRFGPKTVFIPVILGTKKPKHLAWPGTTFEATQTPEYQAELREGNLGVLLGRASNDLVVVDCDSDSAAAQLEQDCPPAKDTLQTRGARGRSFFFRPIDPYPQKILKIKDGAGATIGEWRGGGGAQTVVAGLHPSGSNYQLLNGNSVKAIELSNFPWPIGWSCPWRSTPETEPRPAGELFRRILAYLGGCPAAVSGNGGHIQTLKVATALVIDFELGIDGARPFLWEYNKKCQPPWSEKELEHKLEEAAKNKLGRETGAKIYGTSHAGEGEGSDEDPHDDDHEANDPFPLSAFPPIAQRIINEVCLAELVPASLVGCAALGIVSASIGAGICIHSGSSRLTRGNTHVMAIAESGIGKWSSFRHIAKPFYAREEAMIVQWRREIFPAIAAEIDVLEASYKRAKEIAAKTEDKYEKLGQLEDLTKIKKRIEELKGKSVEPCLSVGDATKEAMAVAMANQTGEALASISSEGRGIIDVLCGRYTNGASDEDFYTAGYTGDPIKVNRISRPATYLKAPCLTVFWMLQPDKIRTILEKANLTESGMLQRFLLCNTRAEPQEEPEEAYVIDPGIFAAWNLRIGELISTYRLRSDPVIIDPTLEAQGLFRGFTNEIVRRRRCGGDLADLQTYAARWAEQAWRLAVGWHALNLGAEAQLSAFDASSAANVLQIARWFAQEQMLLLGMLRTERRFSRVQKLCEVLSRLPDRRSTLRDLKRRNGFEESEVRSLAAEFHHRLEIKTVKPPTGRPTTFAALK